MTTLALYEDALAPGRLALTAAPRVLYIASGEASSLEANEAWFGARGVVEAGGEARPSCAGS